jgi:hypothetical protein
MTPTEAQIGKTLKLSVQAQRSVLQFAEGVLTVHKQFTDMQTKMDAIDIAYARFKAASTKEGSNGQDVSRLGDVGCGNTFAEDDVTPPIVVSQVDSYVAYIADVFLSGTPMFPVVSNPSNRKYAEQLETLLDDHALLGGYARQLMLFIRDGIKYNYSAIETDWDGIDQFSVGADFESGTGKKINRDVKSFTRLKRLNPRNVVRDIDVAPGDVAELGDYAGYIEIISKTKLKRELNKLTLKGEVYNAGPAMASSTAVSTTPGSNYRQDPDISAYVSSTNNSKTGVNWDAYFDPVGTGKNRTTGSYGSKYERFVLYARIMPADMGITAPQKNTPQIWKFVIINGMFLISAKRIISAYDYLPILFGQPLEDGLGYQTQSVAEGEIPFQEAASTLFNIRFASARRAVSDRALYIPELINPKDVNAKGPAPKIPVHISQLSNKKIDDAYKQLPFDNRGLENVIGDAQVLVGFSKELHGLNNPQQGQFQKGNKSVIEWNDTMAGSNNRLRLPALTLEHQVFGPMKSIFVLNIFQYGENAVLISQKSGETITVDIAVLRKQVLAFKVADGYTPKSKLASLDMLTTGLQMISTSPILQQAYGASLPGIFAHMMQLGGVRGLEEYDPNYKPVAIAPAGLMDNGIATPPAPPALGAPMAASNQTASAPEMQAPIPVSPPGIP